MTSNKKIARLAGFVYLVLIISGMFSLLYVPSELIIYDDPASTVQNITDGDTLFRWSIIAGLICYATFLILPLILYKLLAHINKTQAVLMVAFSLISIPVSLYNITHKFDILTLISGVEYLSFLSPEQLQAQVMLSLDSYNNGIMIAQVFWGLWLFPFGYLVYKSNILPKFFGIFLMIGCIGYLLEFIGGFMIDGYYDMGISTYIGIPSAIGEIGICFWMLIAGAKDTQTHNVD
ncbi:DUF4386 domain-containing protein [Aquimarina sp. 2201CG14-23]|uniref:DUF4386 domain-containing protein n=1 Tax=Aquimarina mycalae TaxID=3040073 RepID=UPI002477E8A6|nr:DUF4386 domain-containing protein [Aquimarina sp. 2201CG14-23]MDH7447128.1 DUF4386 domain-containing protein [Aquimarina sp. 2201CG14-23]